MPEDAPSRRIRHANHHPRSRRPQITTSLGRSPPIDNCITAAPRRTLYQRLVAMTATGRIVKSADGYLPPPRLPVPACRSLYRAAEPLPEKPIKKPGWRPIEKRESRLRGRAGAHPVADRWRDQLNNPVPFPELLAEQWGYFCEISATGRGFGGMGTPMPLTSGEIFAWCQLRDIQLLPWELRLLRLLDTAWLNAMRKSG